MKSAKSYWRFEKDFCATKLSLKQWIRENESRKSDDKRDVIKTPKVLKILGKKG